MTWSHLDKVRGWGSVSNPSLRGVAFGDLFDGVLHGLAPAAEHLVPDRTCVTQFQHENEIEKKGEREGG